MDQLAAGKRSMAMHRLGHEGKRRNVVVVPEPRLLVGRDIAGRMDLAFLGADDRPSPFRLHAAHGGVRQRHVGPHAVAMRHLIEAIFRNDRPDADRFEQNVIARVARHRSPPAERTGEIGPARRQKASPDEQVRFDRDPVPRPCPPAEGLSWDQAGLGQLCQIDHSSQNR